MPRRRKKPPRWAQAAVIWFVTSSLLAMGVLYLRATDRLSDRVFGPLAAILCEGDEHIETSYRWVEQERRRDFGDPRDVPTDPVATLGVAECVGPSGKRHLATGFLLAVWLTAASVMGGLVLAAARASSGRGGSAPARGKQHVREQDTRGQ